MKTTLTCVLLGLAGCSGVPDPVDPSCTRGSLEADFAVSAPMSGRAVGADGALAPPPAGTKYVLSSTYLRLQKGERVAKRFRELMAPINAALATHDGLMAIQFAFSEKCTVARTLSVWRDEAAMYKFVGTQAHSAAVSEVSDVSRGGSVVTHWLGTEAEATWDVARARLGADDGPQY